MAHRDILPHHHHNDSPDTLLEENLLSQIPDIEEIQLVAEALKQLGDPSRLQIFWILCHCEECVANLAAMVNMSSPAVSHHLRILKAGGLVTSTRRGKEMHYRASDSELAQSLHLMIEQIGQISCPVQ